MSANPHTAFARIHVVLAVPFDDGIEAPTYSKRTVRVTRIHATWDTGDDKITYRAEGRYVLKNGTAGQDIHKAVMRWEPPAEIQALAMQAVRGAALEAAEQLR